MNNYSVTFTYGNSNITDTIQAANLSDLLADLAIHHTATGIQATVNGIREAAKCAETAECQQISRQCQKVEQSQVCENTEVTKTSTVLSA